MNKLIYNYNLFNHIDDLSIIDSPIHRLHPLTKLLTTFIYLIIIASFPKYEIIRLIPLIIYPIFLIIFSNITIKPIIKKLLFLEPFIFFFGLLNIFFSNEYYLFYGIKISKGILISISIILKTTFSVLTGLVLVSVTGFYNIVSSLQILRVPKYFILLLLLIYRYIFILLEETYKLIISYNLRSNNKNGVNKEHWGPIIGNLLIRTLKRSENIYNAMIMRGFSMNFYFTNNYKFSLWDIIFIFLFIILFLIIRFISPEKIIKL